MLVPTSAVTLKLRAVPQEVRVRKGGRLTQGPFKGRNRAASAEQLEVMQSYNSQETTIFFGEKPKFVARRRSERKHEKHGPGK